MLDIGEQSQVGRCRLGTNLMISVLATGSLIDERGLSRREMSREERDARRESRPRDYCSSISNVLEIVGLQYDREAVR